MAQPSDTDEKSTNAATTTIATTTTTTTTTTDESISTTTTAARKIVNSNDDVARAREAGPGGTGEGRGHGRKKGGKDGEGSTSQLPPFPIRKGCARPIHQEILQQDWEDLCAEEKAILRAQRARRGERCSQCGCVGYFRRNCPTCPPVRYDVRKDEWRFLSAEELQERAADKAQASCDKTPGQLTTGAVATGNEVKVRTGKKDEKIIQNVAGRGILWGPLADKAISDPASWATVDARDDRLETRGHGQQPGGENPEGGLSGIPKEAKGLEGCTGEGQKGVGMEMMMPSLAGSSDISSGVVSEFRRALIWADGGGGNGDAAAIQPSVASSLNDLAGGTVENVKELPSPDSTNGHNNAAHFRHNLQMGSGNSNFGSVSSVGEGSTISGYGGDSGADTGSSGHGGAVGEDDDHRRKKQAQAARGRSLVKKNLTWRWPDFRFTTDANAPNKGQPSSQIVSPVRESDDCDGGGGNGTSGAEGGSEETRVPERSVVEVAAPLPKAPKGSYLRHRGITVRTIQENLHLALARLADAIREQLYLVSSKPFAEEIFTEPRGGEPPEHYYSSSTRKDFRKFFDDEEEEAGRQRQPKAHTHLGSLRGEDRVKYVFDRTNAVGKGVLEDHLWGDYVPRPSGYRGTSVHAATDWRRLNTNLDRHAFSGRDAVERCLKSDKELKKQSVWVGYQSTARAQRRQRANHMFEVYRSELLKEQLREIEVLPLDLREQRLIAGKTIEDQVEAADRIIRTIKRYGLVGNMEEVHYAMYAADAARRALLSDETLQSCESKECRVSTGGSTRYGDSRRGGGRRHEGESADGHGSDAGRGASSGFGVGLKKGNRENAGKRTTKPRGRPRDKNDEDDDHEMSPYRVALTRPGAAVAGTAKPSAQRIHPLFSRKGAKNKGPRASKAARTGEPSWEGGTETASVAAKEAERLRIQMERLRTFQIAGHPLRRGVEDDTTAVPALIPIPEGLGHVDGAQKSYVAGQILDAIRAEQIDAITGRRTKIAIPLWHRATDEVASSGAGSVLYSDLIGHTYSVLVGPKRRAASRTNAR